MIDAETNYEEESYVQKSSKRIYVYYFTGGDAFCAGVLYGLHEQWPLEKCLATGGAFSNFNLRSATASGGAVALDTMLEFMKDAPLSPLPEGMA